MENKEVIFITVLVIAGIAIALSLVLSMINIDEEIIQNTRIINNTKIIDNRQPFEIISKNLANERNYVLDDYDCTEYSNELTRRLRQAGYNAKHIEGYFKLTNNSQEYHSWVKVEVLIEATTGNIIPIEDYHKYKARNEGIYFDS